MMKLERSRIMWPNPSSGYPLITFCWVSKLYSRSHRERCTSCVRGREFEFQAGQILHNMAPLSLFFSTRLDSLLRSVYTERDSGVREGMI